MKGLELAKAYYEEYGRPMIQEKFPKYAERIAVGLAGEGSECFGYDDELSRDHDFEAGFCLWQTRMPSAFPCFGLMGNCRTNLWGFGKRRPAYLEETAGESWKFPSFSEG